MTEAPPADVSPEMREALALAEGAVGDQQDALGPGRQHHVLLVADADRAFGERERLAHLRRRLERGLGVIAFARRVEGSRLAGSRLVRLGAGGSRFGRAAFAAADDEEVSPDQGGADVDLGAGRRDVRIDRARAPPR